MIEALLFDVGEVLLKLDPSRLVQALAFKQGGGAGETLHQLGTWPPYDLFERGKIDGKQFFNAAKERVSTAGLKDATWEQFLAIWNSVLVGEVEGVNRLLLSLKPKYRLFGLSNSNHVHIEYALKNFPCLTHLEHLFTSFEIGARKPEQKAFDFVLRKTKITAGAILFFDDRQENVDAARNVGMKAELVALSPLDLELHLKKHRVI